MFLQFSFVLKYCEATVYIETYLRDFLNHYRKPEENLETDEEQNVDDEDQESGEPKIQMRNVKTNENKSIDVGDGLVEDHSRKSNLFIPYSYKD